MACSLDFEGCLADSPSRHLAAFLTHLCQHLLKSANLDQPVWIQEFANFTPSPEPIWDFGENFSPAITHQLPPEKWLEQNLETRTGKLFERYLAERASQPKPARA